MSLRAVTPMVTGVLLRAHLKVFTGMHGLLGSCASCLNPFCHVGRPHCQARLMQRGGSSSGGLQVYILHKLLHDCCMLVKCTYAPLVMQYVTVPSLA